MTSNSCTPTSTLTSSSVVGGDYAGLSATFSRNSGALIHVPDHLVPEAMLEWGDVPSYLETLTSENESDDGIERTTITVLPEVGCGIDNLETTKKVQVYNADDTECQIYGVEKEQRQIVTVDRRNPRQQFELETIFQAPNEEVTGDNGEITQYPRRVRISFSVDPSKSSLTSDISMQVERQISDQPTRGNKWTSEASNSGGLDARTVVSHIGKEIVNGDKFAVKREKEGVDRWDFVADGGIDTLAGKWTQKRTKEGTQATVKEELHRTISDFGLEPNEESDVTTIRLPQNVLIRFGYKLAVPGESDNIYQCGVETSLFHVVSDKIQRKVVLRLFGDVDESSECKQSTYCWEEERYLSNSADK